MNNMEIDIFDTTRVILKKDYELLDNKPQINSVELSGNKSLTDLGIATKLSDLTDDSTHRVVTDTEKTTWNNKSNFSGNYNDLTNKPTIPDVSNFITKDVNNLTYYTLATNTGSTIELSINSSTYVMTLNLKNSAGTIISTGTVDLPLESVVVNGTYDSTNKKIILTLQNGNTIDVPVGDLVNGLQAEITVSNKLSSDLVDDTNNTNKFVTASEKQTWNAKSNFSGSYNDLTDKPTNVSAFTNDAGYLTQHQDISGKLDTSKVKNEYSTTAGDVYDVTYINSMLGNVESLLSEI